MNLSLRELLQKVDALSQRERIIFFCMVCVCVFVLGQRLILEPGLQAQKQLSEKLQQDQTLQQSLAMEIAQKTRLKDVDPDAEFKQKLQALQTQVQAVDAQMQTARSRLLTPEKMPTFLQTILQQHQNIQLISMRSIPTEDMGTAVSKLAVDVTQKSSAPTSSQNDKHRLGLYEHGFELVISGNYLDVLAYIQSLEKLPEQLYWKQVSMQVDAYPNATFHIRVFTLSLDQKWLRL